MIRKAQLKIYNKIVDQELSVRKVEEIVRKLSDEVPAEEIEKEKPQRDYEALKQHLKKYFNSKLDSSVIIMAVAKSLFRSKLMKIWKE
jgi:ParB family chromosome partitioning protein